MHNRFMRSKYVVAVILLGALCVGSAQATPKRDEAIAACGTTKDTCYDNCNKATVHEPDQIKHIQCNDGCQNSYLQCVHDAPARVVGGKGLGGNGSTLQQAQPIQPKTKGSNLGKKKF
jgi:hypothetical protein